MNPGDPQTAVSHLGDVVLFVQYTKSRFHVSSRGIHICQSLTVMQLDTAQFSLEDRTLSSSFLDFTDVVHSADDMLAEDGIAFGAWFKALFDSNSEGIEDTILRQVPLIR